MTPTRPAQLSGPPTSIYDAVMAAALALVETLTLDGLPVSQRQTRKLPAVEEVIDSLPLLCLVPADKPEEPKLASTRQYNREYHIDFIFITAGNLDLSLTSKIPTWRQEVFNAFKAPLCIAAAVPSVWNTWLTLAPVIDRRKISRLYDYSGLGVRFVSEE